MTKLEKVSHFLSQAGVPRSTVAVLALPMVPVKIVLTVLLGRLVVSMMIAIITVLLKQFIFIFLIS